MIKPKQRALPCGALPSMRGCMEKIPSIVLLPSIQKNDDFAKSSHWNLLKVNRIFINFTCHIGNQIG